MKICTGKWVMIFVVVLLVSVFIAPAGYSKELKVGYVDLRQAFYEYDKAKNMEGELNSLTEDRQGERNGKVQIITKLQDEAELLNGGARANKQKEIDAQLMDLQEFDIRTRQELLNKKNDMFRKVIDDIQKVVEAMGKTGKYDYILDSRNIMYSNETYDMTGEVVKKLNNK